MPARSRRTRHQDRQRWRLPTDPPPPADPGPDIPVLPYALAAGLLATLSGELASLAVPGTAAFLIVWAAIALTVAIAAGRMAPRLYGAALRMLIHLIDRAIGRRR